MVAFVKNTQTFFNQTTAPVGWSKNVSSDDYTLRLVSGSGGSLLGTNGVSTVFVDGTWPSTISGSTGSVAEGISDLPSHQHTFSYESMISQGQIMVSYPGGGQYVVTSMGTTTTSPGGSPNPHTHGVSATGSITSSATGFGVKYVDFIQASKV